MGLPRLEPAPVRRGRGMGVARVDPSHVTPGEGGGPSIRSTERLHTMFVRYHTSLLW